jgi:phage gp45-like
MLSEMGRGLRQIRLEVMQRLRGIVQSATLQGTDDAQGIQHVTVKILGDDEREQVEHFQPYGLTAKVPAGARGIFLSVGGKSDGGAALCFGVTTGRPSDLLDKEVSLWSQHGQEVRLKTDGSIVAIPKSGKTFDIGTTANDNIVIGQALHAYLTALFAAGTPAGGDGGAALQTAWKAYVLANPFTSFSSTKGRAE